MHARTHARTHVRATSQAARSSLTTERWNSTPAATTPRDRRHDRAQPARPTVGARRQSSIHRNHHCLHHFVHPSDLPTTYPPRLRRTGLLFPRSPSIPPPPLPLAPTPPPSFGSSTLLPQPIPQLTTRPSRNRPSSHIIRSCSSANPFTPLRHSVLPVPAGQQELSSPPS